jgi:asparagine synthase (glutamine-hydrolysing)
VTVALSGDGGDELFGGYTRYGLGRRVWKKVELVPRPLRAAAGRAIAAPPPALWEGAFRLAAPFLARKNRERRWAAELLKLGSILGSAGAEEYYLNLVSQWPPEETLVEGLPDGLPSALEGFESVGLRDFTAWMMLTDFRTYLPDDILVKVDRASMGVSLEARVPYLDPRVIEFAMRLPMTCKVRDGEEKWILRQVLQRHVPRALFDRPKQGFALPLGAWLRGPLRDWAEALLAEGRLRASGLRPEPVRRRWAEHLAGRADAAHPLWCVLMYQAWTESR